MASGSAAIVGGFGTKFEGREPVNNLWRATLSRVPTLFGQLAFVASLRDQSTNLYSHPALTRLADNQEMDRTLCHSHHQVFFKWINLSLSEQSADLAEYLEGRPDPESLSREYRALIPVTARDVEKQLYLTDLETLLELLRVERSGAFSSRGA